MGLDCRLTPINVRNAKPRYFHKFYPIYEYLGKKYGYNAQGNYELNSADCREIIHIAENYIDATKNNYGYDVDAARYKEQLPLLRKLCRLMEKKGWCCSFINC